MIRLIEGRLPETAGLAEIVWRYAAGIEPTVADRLALIAITTDLRRR